ncbi:MAG: M28 family peptidase [Alphaproteobacteria bacterium]|nr:M28 family peptidase [Alphaproteobacteria bacterium]
MNEIERQILADVTLDAPWALIEDYAKMPRWRPEDVNGGVDHLVTALAKVGVPVTVLEPEIYLSIPLHAAVTVGNQSFRAKPPSMSISVPNGIEAELLYLRTNPKTIRSYTRDPNEIFLDGGAELAQRVKGRIVIMEGFANPGTCSLLEEWGAVGVIAVNPGVDIHWGTCTTIWGSPDLDDLPRKPKIAVVAVNNPDGKQLIAAAAEGKRGRVVTEMQEGWFKQKLPVVEIRGTEEPDRFVFVHGHLDSWDVGIGDNATGDATMLEMARVLWKHREKMKRSVRIAWWPGHSTGRYAGSTWYADAYALDFDANCVAQIDCDSPGCRWATSYHQTTTMSETEAHVMRAIKEVTGVDGKPKRPNQAGDYSFNNIGISSYFMLSSTMPEALRAEKGYYAVSGCGGNIAWHTENDTIEIADKEILMNDIKIYLLTTLRNANDDVLPYDWRATAAEFGRTIESYQKAAGAAFDLAPSKAALASFAASLDKLYSGIASGKAKKKAANEALMRLARVLVPINFTREPRFRHDPAYTCPPLPTLATAAELPTMPARLVGFAKTTLMRGQNRFCAAMRDAERIVEQALAA